MDNQLLNEENRRHNVNYMYDINNVKTYLNEYVKRKNNNDKERYCYNRNINCRMSIFDIIYECYNKHLDIKMTKDAILSQFFLIFFECEKNDVFKKKSEKVQIIVEVQENMTKEELKLLPLQFTQQLNMSSIDINNINDEEIKDIIKNCSISTNVACMCALSKRINYTCETLCKVPEFEILSTKEEIERIINLMDRFMCIELNDGQQRSEYYEMLKDYVILIKNIYEMYYNNNKNERFFRNLIQKNNESGCIVSGFIVGLMDVKNEGTVNVNRICYEKKYDDLIYNCFLLGIECVDNTVLWTTSYSHPMYDTTDEKYNKNNDHEIVIE